MATLKCGKMVSRIVCYFDRLKPQKICGRRKRREDGGGGGESNANREEEEGNKEEIV